MKILVIGCGYVGSAAAKLWKSNGHVVAATTRSPDKVSLLLRFVDYSFLWQEQDLQKAFHGQEAVLFSVAADSSKDFQEAYAENARKIVHFALKENSVKQVLYTSSTSVYGEHSGSLVNEETSCIPQTTQAQILYETEKILMDGLNKLVCILRLGEICGEGREIQNRLKKLQGKGLPGTGENFVNLSSLPLILQGLNFALINHLSGIYNLCSPHHPTRKELYDAICMEENLPPIQWDPTQLSIHGGNKKVSCLKIQQAGLQI